MKISAKLLALIVGVAASTGAFAQAKDAYVQDARGVVVRNNSFGDNKGVTGKPVGNLCWRTNFWTPANAIAECDPDLVPRPPAPVAPPVARPPAPPPTVARPPAATCPPTIKSTFAADSFFDTAKAVLKPEAKAKMDDLVGKIKAITLEVVISVGHTDSVGGDAYNQKLSVRRAEAVKAYLVSKGIEANRVYTEGKGKKQPVADNKTAEGRAKNRRVEIEVVGSTKNPACK